MLGGYISDLEAGDVFEPVEYVLTAFMASEYAHGVEESWEGFQSSHAPGGRQMRTPTMIHVDKMRILEKNCLKEQRVGGAKGPHARIHYEYFARHHSPAYVGERLVVSGRITDKYVKARPGIHRLLPRGADVQWPAGHYLHGQDAAPLRAGRWHTPRAVRPARGG